jgi:signal transduction histidine kinase
MLVNLVGNSIEAMKGTANPRLLVRVSATHDRKTSQALICITVADTGTGMPAAVRQRLFEPFVTAWPEPAAGLGLWVSREIASKHKGNLQIRSSQGKGTVVAVHLPYLEPSN